MKIRIYIPDIECDSCSRLLKHRFEKLDGIKELIIDNSGMDIDFDDKKLSVKEMIEIIQDSGFRASLKPFERKTFRERMRDFSENKVKYSMQIKAFNYALLSFTILIVLNLLAYVGLFRSIPNFLNQFGPWIIYLDISVAVLGAALWYFYSFRPQVTCMTGMMVGMTIGMQVGMMIGAIVGAVNGFFIGAVIGMILGIIAGIITGNCCGTMGVMQGMMAGMMGGTMGPMITFMMYTDHVLWFMPIFTLFNILIVAGFVHMYFEESIEHKRDVPKRKIDFLTFASIVIIVTALLTAIIVYSPKSALFG